AVTALLRGDVQMAVMPAGSVAPLAAEGKLKLLAVTSPPRSAPLPAGPALGGAGARGGGAGAPGGRVRPARASRAGAGRGGEGGAVVGSAAVVEKLKAQVDGADRQLARSVKARLREEHDRWAPIIAAGGIKVD